MSSFKRNILKGSPRIGFAVILLLSILVSSSSMGDADAKFVIIVNSKNTVNSESIKNNHIRNIFMLNKNKWQNGKRAKPFFPSKNNPSYKYLLKHVLRVSEAKLNRHWLQIKQRTGTSMPPTISRDNSMVKTVENNVGAIAIVNADTELPSTVKVLRKLD